MIKYFKDENFDGETDCDLILVDFYADWCGPCKMLGKVLEEIDSIDVLKINVDEHADLAKKFGVMSIPTGIFFSKKNMVKKFIGFVSKSELEEMIENIKKEIQ